MFLTVWRICPSEVRWQVVVAHIRVLYTCACYPWKLWVFDYTTWHQPSKNGSAISANWRAGAGIIGCWNPLKQFETAGSLFEKSLLLGRSIGYAALYPSTCVSLDQHECATKLFYCLLANIITQGEAGLCFSRVFHKSKNASIGQCAVLDKAEKQSFRSTCVCFSTGQPHGTSVLVYIWTATMSTAQYPLVNEPSFAW